MTFNFQWDAKQGRYRRNGRYLAAVEVQDAIDAFLSGQSANNGRDLFQILRSGQANVRDVQLAGERAIARAHLAAAMAMKGGRAQMSQADYGRVGGIVRGELGYWRDLMGELAAGRPIDGSVAASIRGYFAAAANTGWRVEDLEMEKRGFDLVANDLQDGAHHCEPSARPSCEQVTLRGFVPPSKFVPRGGRTCRWGCLCRRIWKNSTTGEIWK